MISDLEFDTFDSEVDQLFREAKAEALELGAKEGVPDEERIERIVEKAQHEAVIRDTTTFLFRSFAPALGELFGALLRALIKDGQRQSETFNRSDSSESDSEPDNSPSSRL